MSIFAKSIGNFAKFQINFAKKFNFFQNIKIIAQFSFRVSCNCENFAQISISCFAKFCEITKTKIFAVTLTTSKATATTVLLPKIHARFIFNRGITVGYCSARWTTRIILFREGVVVLNRQCHDNGMTLFSPRFLVEFSSVFGLAVSSAPWYRHRLLSNE